VVLTLGQAVDLVLAPLEDASACDGEVGKAAVAFGSLWLAAVERVDKAATELLHFGEGVGFAAGVEDDDLGALPDGDIIRLEIPIGIGMALDGLVEQSGEVGLSAESNVLAEVRSHAAFLGVGIGRAVESSGITLIKGDNLDGHRGDFFLF